MIFNWYLEPEFARFKVDQHTYKEGKEGSGEYIGCVRTGNLCFDITDWGDHLWFDLYVGGVNTGYGYGAHGYPYDYFPDGFEFSDDMSKMSDEEFKKKIEKIAEQFVLEHKEYDTTDNVRNCHVNLLDKANEPLREW